MGRSKKKKKKPAEEVVDPIDPVEGDASGVEDLTEPAADVAETTEADVGDMDAAAGGDPVGGDAAGGGLDGLLGEIDAENSPLIPDPLDAEADEAALVNEAEAAAIKEAEDKNRARKSGALSAKAAKMKAKKEKIKANKLAAAKAETAEKQQKEKIKRQRTIASQQNKTARERILRGETGARGRMFSRINAKFQIPDAPANFPRIGGSGTQYN